MAGQPSRGLGRQAVRAAGLAAAAAALAFAAQALLARAADRALIAQAEHAARHWAAAQAAGAAEPPAALRRLRIWGPDGVLRGESGAEAGTPAEAPSAAAWAAAAAGRVAVALRARDADGTPDRAVALTALPGAAGTAELTLDLGGHRRTLIHGLRAAGLALGGLATAAAAALGLFWLALVRRMRAAEDGLRDLARRDPVTGLASRAGFAADAAALAERARAEGGRLAVICLDLDGFRTVNETQGHAAGDALLRAVAAALRAGLRREDALGRLGADEFAVAARVRGEEDLGALLARLPHALARADGDGPAPVASLGAVLLPPGSADVETALRRADIALDEARDEGGGRARLFAPEMEERLRHRRRIEACIRDGMAAGRFALAYQPRVSAEDGRTVGAEALMRLTDAQGTPIPPADFIPVAERTGAILELGAWAIRTATAEAAGWPAPLRVSVNLSARQFRDGRLPETVRAALAASGLAPERLELEVTESLLITEPEEVTRQLAELRGLGVSVAMDDFGTGYSSLAHLWRFGFDRLKLDRSFARALAGGDARVRDVIAAVVALGRRLGLAVTAEGIESEVEARALAELGADELQGFHFGRPMPAEALRETLRWSAEAVRSAERPPERAPAPASRRA